MLFGVDVAASAVGDDPEHVVYVGELVVVLEDLLEQRLGLVVLLLRVVLPAYCTSNCLTFSSMKTERTIEIAGKAPAPTAPSNT